MFKISFQRMGAHARFAKFCAVGGVAASFALVKVEYIVENKFLSRSSGGREKARGQVAPDREGTWRIGVDEQQPALED